MPAEFTDDFGSSNRYIKLPVYYYKSMEFQICRTFHSSSAMLYLLTLFFGLLAHGSHGTNDRCSREGLDYGLIPFKWEQGASSLPPREVEDDVSTCVFKNGFLNTFKQYGDRLMLDIKDQVENATQFMIKEFQDATKRVQQLAKSDEKYTNQRDLDNALSAVIVQLDAFLELRPGYAVIRYKKLPEVPDRCTEIPPPPDGPRTPQELFLGFPKIMYEQFLTTHGVIQDMYTTGWAASEPYHYTFATQLREVYVNGKMLPAFKKSLDSIMRYIGDMNQKNAMKRTWIRFKQAADRLNRIPDTYCNASSSCCNYKL